jgi:hypothetical protein
MSKLSKTEAKWELWRRGKLFFKLDQCQKELYDLYYNSNFKVQTWLLSRRAGKSYTLCILALEQCIRQSNSIVKFVSPTKLQVQNNVRPLFNQILADCPDDIKPEFKEKTQIYYFPNGSEIQLAGTDSKHAEKLRGGDSHIAIVDEAGSCDDLDNVVKSILLPTTLITRGKIILASTPPSEPDHDFLKFIEEAETRGSLIKKTIHDNPRITAEQLEELKVELGGENTDAWKRECLCEIIRSSNTSVVPEFTAELEKEVVKEWPLPPFYDTYVSMDLGGKDLTVVLFAYYDFRTDKVIIQDEICMNFNENGNNIETLTQKIQAKEKQYWYNILTNEQKQPYLRVSDIDYIVTGEILKYSNYKINFIPAKKDNKEAALNNLRVMMGSKKVIIHPRCETLIRHLRNVKWHNTNTKHTFARSPDDGHYDAVDALVYLLRSIVYIKNPYPAHYGRNTKDLHVHNPDNYYKQSGSVAVFKKIFGIKPRN